MTSLVSRIHSAVAGVVKVLWLPIDAFSQPAQLMVVSTILGLMMVVIFGRLSNQAGIKKVKNDISAAMMETILFRYDTVMSLRAQGSLFWAGCRYFALALWPVFVLSVPFTLILGHLNLRLGYRPISVGEHAIVEVRSANASDLTKMSLSSSPGLEVAGPVRSVHDASLTWRVTVSGEAIGKVGGEELSLHSNDFIANSSAPYLVEKIVVQDPKSANRTPGPLGLYLNKSDLFMTILFPNGGPEQSLKSPAINSISFTYPERFYNLFGFDFSWLSVFLIVSILAGYVGSRIFGISV